MVRISTHDARYITFMRRVYRPKWSIYSAVKLGIAFSFLCFKDVLILRLNAEPDHLQLQ